MGTAEITKALVAFQAAMPKVPKTKTNPAFHSKYADLADVTDAAMPLLSAQGLAFSVTPRFAASGGYEAAGVLLHTSGESIEAALPLAGGLNPQQMGSALTYARRYLFGCLTGIVTDDDEDGNAASQRAPRAPRTPAAPAPDDPWATTPPPPDAAPRPSGGGSRPASENQQKAVHAVMGKAGFTERDDILTELTSMFGREIHSARDLTSAEASLAIKTYEIPEATP